jgi:hypothetical protein
MRLGNPPALRFPHPELYRRLRVRITVLLSCVFPLFGGIVASASRASIRLAARKNRCDRGLSAGIMADLELAGNMRLRTSAFAQLF